MGSTVIKLFLRSLFVTFAFATTIYAADPNVLITCTDEGGGVIRVDYQVLVEDGVTPTLMRGIALDIIVDGGATIDAISDFATGSTPADSTQIPTGYSIFMGSIQFAADPNYVADFGDPVAPSTDPDTLGGLGTSGITVEMGSLYAEGDPVPGKSGMLFRLKVTENCTMTIAANPTRGGCVLEDGSPANVVSPGCPISIGPPCWSCSAQPFGDTNGDGKVDFADLINLKKAFNTTSAGSPHGTGPGEYNCCADFDHSGAINFAELIIIKKNWILINHPPCADISCP